jgi:sec-independent protein translocase protein TatA
MILFGIPGPTSMLIVLVIVLLLFGSRLPSTMRSLGRGVTEFKKGLAGEEGETDENPPKVKQEEKAS